MSRGDEMPRPSVHGSSAASRAAAWWRATDALRLPDPRAFLPRRSDYAGIRSGWRSDLVAGVAGQIQDRGGQLGVAVVGEHDHAAELAVDHPALLRAP